MVGSVVGADELEWVPREVVTAVIVNSLHAGEHEEACALADSHARKLEGETGAQCIEEEALEGVVVECAVGIWNI